jgi:protein gp37
MGDKSTIEWTDGTWNPATGCTHVSAGCDHCYAERLAVRLQRMGQPKYANGFAYAEHAEALTIPRQWTRPRRIFVNSMSDLFHEDATKTFVYRVLETMVEIPRHTYQVLTKRPGKAAAWVNGFCRERGLERLPGHVWLGASVEDARVRFRIDQLRRAQATIRFLSCEPLLGPLPDLDLAGIHWVIAGGESGPGHRPIGRDWVREIRDQCLLRDIPFFFKQWGGITPKASGRMLDGRTWDEFPEQRLPALRELDHDVTGECAPTPPRMAGRGIGLDRAGFL